MPVTDESNVLEGLSFVTPNGGKGALCSHISQHMVKSLSELEKSHSWRFGPQRSETFSRVAELRQRYKFLNFDLHYHPKSLVAICFTRKLESRSAIALRLCHVFASFVSRAFLICVTSSFSLYRVVAE